VVSSKQAVTALRIALILGTVLTSIDADSVHAAVEQAETQTPSVWKLLRTACSKEVRQAAGLGVSLARIVGAALLMRQRSGHVRTEAPLK
jgi:hypothetical protein